MLPLLGYQNISNALAASALAFCLKIPLQQIKVGLSTTPIIPGRLESIEINPNKIIINDTYNSNVSSTISAIKVLEKMPGYKILVIGNMEELGKNSILYHKMIGNIASISKIDKIFSFGKKSYTISKMCQNGVHFLEKKKIKEILKKIISKKNKITVLIKGSRKTKMETIIKYLLKELKK
ncbi:glutamate ligase domain-containing protein [Buchnera aphidicola]|uniref:glutamate ligase domain-containing protein n=1 Tax=Buchnera aphidicola TaxID=9 RepID=UPI0028FCF7FD|nr:cyanophycin synthetase [Buchnera aphidicola]